MIGVNYSIIMNSFLMSKDTGIDTTKSNPCVLQIKIQKSKIPENQIITIPENQFKARFHLKELEIS